MPLTWQWLESASTADRLLIARLPSLPSRSAQVEISEALACRLYSAMGVEINGSDLGRTIYGKPQLRCRNHQNLHHNISNTGCITIGVITTGHSIGVDIEARDRRLHVRPELLMRKLFHTEKEGIKCLEYGRLIDVWIAKEAVLKASGFGLTIGMQEVDLAKDFRSAMLNSWTFDLRNICYENYRITIATQIHVV